MYDVKGLIDGGEKLIATETLVRPANLNGDKII